MVGDYTEREPFVTVRDRRDRFVRLLEADLDGETRIELLLRRKDHFENLEEEEVADYDRNAELAEGNVGSVATVLTAVEIVQGIVECIDYLGSWFGWWRRRLATLELDDADGISDMGRLVDAMIEGPVAEFDDFIAEGCLHCWNIELPDELNGVEIEKTVVRYACC